MVRFVSWFAAMSLSVSGLESGSERKKMACEPECDVRESTTIPAETEWIYWPAGDVRVATVAALDGGGSALAMDLARYVHNRLGRKIPRCAELCAGPGFIAFTLMALEVCDTVVLVDAKPAALAAQRETLRANPQLEGRVSIYHADVFDGVPDAELGQWDLVVSNPPHYHQDSPYLAIYPGDAWMNVVDTDWLLHRRFYAGVHRYLRPNDGHVVFLENHEGSSVETFVPMLSDTKLVVANVEGVGGLAYKPEYWYLHSTNAVDWWRRVSEVPNPCLVSIRPHNMAETMVDIQRPELDGCNVPRFADGPIISSARF